MGGEERAPLHTSSAPSGTAGAPGWGAPRGKAGLQRRARRAAGDPNRARGDVRSCRAMAAAAHRPWCLQLRLLLLLLLLLLLRADPVRPDSKVRALLQPGTARR